MASTLSLHHRFHPDVSGVKRDGTRLELEIANWNPIKFATPTAALADAVEALRGGGATFEAMLDLASREEPDQAKERLEYYLERFRRGRLLEWTVLRDGRELMVLRPLQNGYGFSTDSPPAGTMRLSRFAYLRRRDDGLTLECPETACRIYLKAWETEWLEPGDGSGDDDAAFIRDLLWRAGFLEPEEMEESHARATWQFHDLMFHVSTRMMWSDQTLGGTYRFEDQFPAPPAVKQAMEGDLIALPAIDADEIRSRSNPFDAIVDRRRSLRDYDNENPLTMAQLGEFLHRVARIKAVLESKKQDLLSRPYPAGGSINELEYYVAVRDCDGLQPGLYHYEGLNHALRALADTGEAATALTSQSGMSMGQPDDPPQALVVISARHPRMAWKYAGMSYRATLMNVGVVIQTMYLTATDMGIAGCANGTGSSKIFTDATGLDSFQETAVGEFALGSHRQDTVDA